MRKTSKEIIRETAREYRWQCEQSLLGYDRYSKGKVYVEVNYDSIGRVASAIGGHVNDKVRRPLTFQTRGGVLSFLERRGRA